jgi:hypothetical protein
MEHLVADVEAANWKRWLTMSSPRVHVWKSLEEFSVRLLATRAACVETLELVSDTQLWHSSACPMVAGATWNSIMYERRYTCKCGLQAMRLAVRSLLAQLHEEKNLSYKNEQIAGREDI